MKKTSRAKPESPQFLVADFGGTNARAALARVGAKGVEIKHLVAGPLGPRQTPAHWLAAYYRDAGSPAIGACAACAAGPVMLKGSDTVVKFTNRDAELKASQLARACGIAEATLVNDFAAVAHAIPVLHGRDLRAIGSGGRIRALAGAPQLAIGPGTGLGVALRVPLDERAVIVPAEGGHAALGPFDRETLALWPILAELHDGQLSAEDVLCGPGLERLYAACALVDGMEAIAGLDAVSISKLGIAGKDPTCTRAVAVFTRWLGNYAGSLALVAGARGGVFLAGGILPGWGAGFDVRRFRAAFDRQVAMEHYVRSIPVHLMRHAEPALAGLAALASESLAQAE